MESIQTYNVLFQYLLDFSCDTLFKAGATAWGSTATRSGYTFLAATDTVIPQATFCIPIVSGIFGTLCENFLPLGQMGDDLRVKTTFDNVGVPVCFGTATTAPEHYQLLRVLLAILGEFLILNLNYVLWNYLMKGWQW